MNRFKKLAAPVAGIALVAAGLASAAATDPIPNPLPNAVAGNVIKASDINDIATAVGILDERIPGPISLDGLGIANHDKILADSNGNVAINGSISIRGISTDGPDRTKGIQFGDEFSGITSSNFNPAGSAGYRSLTFYVTGYDYGNAQIATRDAMTIGGYGGDITLSSLVGIGNAFVCVNDSGTLYRSATACN